MLPLGAFSTFLIGVIFLSQFTLALDKKTVKTKACKDGWTELALSNSTYTEGPVCVKINPTKATFLEAAKSCRADGGELATILSDDMQIAVQNAITNKTKTPEKHWIGLFDFSLEGSFNWTSGYQALPAAFWSTDDPNDSQQSQDCIVIDPSKPANASWYDEFCAQQFASVCMSAKFAGAPSSVVLETKEGTCPAGFFRMGNRCLKIFKETVTFDEARTKCQKLAPTQNGDLASIYSADEQNILTALMRTAEQAVWIGLRLNPTTRVHSWSRGLYPVTFTNWKQNEPNGGVSASNTSMIVKLRVFSEQCVMMYKRNTNPGQWNDQKCDSKLGYICGADLKPGKNDDKGINPLFLSSGKCQKGEFEFDAYCYKASETPVSSYDEAEAACQKINKDAHITTPHNAFDVAYTSVLMHRLKINFTLLGYQIKESNTDFNITTADKSSEMGLESLRGIHYHLVDGTSCIATNGDPQHRVSITKCSLNSTFRPVCSYPLEHHPLHPEKKMDCEKEWTAISHQRCMKRFHEKKTMMDANAACAKLGGSLISVLNVYDQQQLLSWASSSDGLWIGLQVSFADNDTEQNVRWVETGRPVTYLHWRAGEPTPMSRSGKAENCVVVRKTSADWNNVECSKTFSYVCSKQATPPTTVPPVTKPTTASPTTTTTEKQSTTKPTPAPTTKPTPAPTPKPVPKCPTGFLEGPTGNCYKVVKSTKTWHDAEKLCETLVKNSHLVSIHSEAEQTFVHGLVTKSGLASLWIGLNDLHGPVENQFQYWSDKSPLTIMLMNTTHKSSHFDNLDCVVIRLQDGMWHREHCTTTQPGFLCMTASKSQPKPPPEPQADAKFCQKGFVKFNDACYRLVQEPTTFNKASQKCQDMFHPKYKKKVHLARVNTVKDNDFLLSLLSPIKNKQAWIGMHFLNGAFHWVDNYPVQFTKWPVNMTRTDKSKTCVALGASTVTILSGFWYARECDEKFPFLCQAPLTSNQEEDPTAENTKCADNYALYPDGQSCYRYLNKSTSFEEGKKLCAADKSALKLSTTPSLLTINSVFEMSFFRAWAVQSGLPLDKAVWVGLQLKKDKPVWEWTTGDPVDFVYTSGASEDNFGCYFMYIHRKVENNEESTNVYGMHPDPHCGNTPSTKLTTVCKYTLAGKSIVPKPQECLATKDGVGYKGHQAVTTSGKACVRWDMVNDIHLLMALNQKIGGADSNFCRNPAGKPHQRDRPYCYTSLGKASEGPTLEYCDIPLCATQFAGHAASHSYVVAVAILVIVLLVTISFFVGVMLWRRTNTARGFIPYLRQHDPEGGTSFHNPIYTPAANC